MKSQKTEQEINKLFEEYNLKCVILEFTRYSSNTNKLKCLACGNCWYGQPSKLIYKAKIQDKRYGCPVCSRKLTGKRKSNKSSIEFEKILSNTPDIIKLTPYVRMKDPITLKHLTCGRTYITTPGNAIKRNKVSLKCPLCGLENNPGNSHSEEEFAKDFNEKFGDNFEYIRGTYSKFHEDAEFICKKCNIYFFAQPASFRTDRQNHCPKCTSHPNKYYRLTTEEEIFNEFGTEYTLIYEYNDRRENIKIKHNKCGYEWIARKYNFLRHESNCKICHDYTSNGEKAVMSYLKSTNIKYEHQKRFDWCADKQKLPFDFYLPEYNIIIEVDGKQHYEPTERFGGEEGFRYRHEHDLYKDNQAAKHGIEVYRLNYSDSDTEKLKQNLIRTLRLCSRQASCRNHPR